jgi:hypothetical protein
VEEYEPLNNAKGAPLKEAKTWQGENYIMKTFTWFV